MTRRRIWEGSSLIAFAVALTSNRHLSRTTATRAQVRVLLHNICFVFQLARWRFGLEIAKLCRREHKPQMRKSLNLAKDATDGLMNSFQVTETVEENNSFQI